MEKDTFLRKQAWDYFQVHASQRLTIFNFYVVLSSVTVTTYFSSFKADSNLQTARPALAGLLCFLAFVFLKLDQRNKFLIKNAERALKHFEQMEHAPVIAKVFMQEEVETESKRLVRWQRLLFWSAHLSYSNCFNMVFVIFFLVGLGGVIHALWLS